MKLKDATVALCLAAVLTFSVTGCTKKPKLLALPKPPDLPLPVASPPQPVATTTAPAPEPERTPAEPERPPINNKPKPKHHRPATATPPPQPAQPPRTTVDTTNKPEPSGSISAEMDHSDVTHEKQTIAQLLQSTENNLRSITRTLSADEQSVVGQIRNFVAQSRSASTEGDLVRAHNLALKARLLSDELIRR